MKETLDDRLSEVAVSLGGKFHTNIRLPGVRGEVTYAITKGDSLILIEVLYLDEGGEYSLGGAIGANADRVLRDGESFEGSVLTVRRYSSEWVRAYPELGFKVFPVAFIESDQKVSIGEGQYRGLYLTSKEGIAGTTEYLLHDIGKEYDSGVGFLSKLADDLMVKNSTGLTRVEEGLRDYEIASTDRRVSNQIEQQIALGGSSFTARPGIGLLSEKCSVLAGSKGGDYEGSEEVDEKGATISKVNRLLIEGVIVTLLALSVYWTFS